MRRWHRIGLAGVLATGCDGGLDRLADTATGDPATQALPDDVPPEGPPLVEAFLVGPFVTLPAYVGVAEVSGQAQLVRRLDGTGDLSLAASGLAPGLPHTAHVHVWPCSYEGGGHYLLDPSVIDGGEANEVWATLTPDQAGNAHAARSVAAVRGDALSVVLHEPETGEKLACADLLPKQPVGGAASGAVAPFAQAEAIDETIGGTVDGVIGGSSRVDLSLTGLTPTETYAAHVHALPCDVLDGGGHYKLDPTVEGTEAANEVWPEVVAGADGSSVGAAEVPGHLLREDAQSVVVHRTSAPDAPKVACGDLTRSQYLPYLASGPFAPVGGVAAVMGGSAALERRMDGATVLTVEVAGVASGARYPVHLHALPCAVRDGGDHYLFDPALPEGEGNELWADVVGSPFGTATRSVGRAHLARADAQSVVVHDEVGTRLACADLR